MALRPNRFFFFFFHVFFEVKKKHSFLHFFFHAKIKESVNDMQVFKLRCILSFSSPKKKQRERLFFININQLY